MIKQERKWLDPFSISYLIVMLLLAGYSLEDTLWVTDLNRVTILALMGVVVGLALGQSQFNARISFWLGLIFSVELLTWQIVFTGANNLSWMERANHFFIRVSAAISQFSRNQPLQDGILFFISMTFLFWFLGLFSGYTFSRYGKPWFTLFMVGCTIFIIQLFQSVVLRNNFQTAVYVFLFLSLVTRMKYLSSHLEWERQNIAEDKDTFSIINRVSFIMVIIFILIAWNTPYLIKAATSGTKEQLELRDRFKGVWDVAENFFAPLKHKQIFQSGFLSDTLTLSTGRSTKEDILFVVTTPGLKFYQNRYYWQGRYYDKYISGLWQNSGYSEEKTLANQIINSSEKNESELGRFLVQVFSRLYSIYFPQIPLSINRDTNLLLTNNEEQREVITILPVRVLEQGENYELNAALVDPTLEDLLSAERTYPEWVSDEYLQLPESISPRIRDLSISITQNTYNTYEKIQAITKYLRENLSYADIISDLPLDNSDPVEWFLFTEKRGFCTYFASAEVLLLRSIGIPARIVVGYAQGKSLENGKKYEVSDKDNHAWPEVFFSGIGWIAFEPTPSQPNILYLSGTEKAKSESQLNQESDSQKSSQPNLDKLGPNLWNRNHHDNQAEEISPQSQIVSQIPSIWYLMGFGIGTFLLYLIITKALLKGKPIPVYLETKLNETGIASPSWIEKWAHYVQLSPIEKDFIQLDWMLFLLGHKYNPAETSRQKLNKLIKMVQGSTIYLNQFLYEYEREMFGPYHADPVVARKLLKVIWKKTLIKWSKNFIDRIKNRLVILIRR
jgi:transglutaminase-like putative cysteine protease